RLKEMVGDLVGLVEGASSTKVKGFLGSGGNGHGREVVTGPVSIRRARPKSLKAPERHDTARTGKAGTASAGSDNGKSSAEEMIPMEEDFKDF
ncbi:MAG: hypothetical protein HQK86_13320, partial [Nitrospinae bacterium]|nr:hypothetical protein [Nitrospinota bacterium]